MAETVAEKMFERVGLPGNGSRGRKEESAKEFTEMLQTQKPLSGGKMQSLGQEENSQRP